MTAHNQLSLPVPAPTPTDPPVFRCKKCKIPLPDDTWKNCASCRRSRTEYYNRWKKSASLRSMSRVDLNYSTLSQAPGSAAPPDQHPIVSSHHEDPSESSPVANDQPPWTSASTIPRPAAGAIEYQWSEELIEAVLALPPRSRYIGKFSIIADPTVNNSTRAHLFADQLHARAVPISNHSQPVSLNVGTTNSCTLVSYCTCQEGCQGRFVLSVDDDPSHPYGVPGQRIGVVVVHPGPPD